MFFFKMVNKLKVKKIVENAFLPEYAFTSDVCLDLRALETTSIASMEQKEFRTGLAFEIPEGHIGLIRDRAGIITKIGCHVVAGTFNSAYREEITVFMINYGVDEVQIEAGMKIAQIVILPVVKMSVEEVKELSETDRSGKKYGVSGLK